ncbi:hypothetical protein LINGRAHAP2_LOCUS25817 [Linum grandiflorum]
MRYDPFTSLQLVENSRGRIVLSSFKWQTFRSVLQLQEYCCRTSNCWGVNKLVHVLDCQPSIS